MSEESGITVPHALPAAVAAARVHAECDLLAAIQPEQRARSHERVQRLDERHGSGAEDLARAIRELCQANQEVFTQTYYYSVTRRCGTDGPSEPSASRVEPPPPQPALDSPVVSGFNAAAPHPRSWAVLVAHLSTAVFPGAADII